MGILKDLKNRLLVKKEAQKAVAEAPVEKKIETKSQRAVKKSEASANKKITSLYPQLENILLRPIVTEKTTALGESNRQYVFEVPIEANKVEIKKAIQNRYHVKPVKIQTINQPESRVRFGRFEGTTKRWKKAIVTLHEKDKIDVFETSH